MPPQPITFSKPNIRYRLFFDNFDDQPQVAQAIAEAIATWSRVELNIGYLFVSLLQTNESDGASLYATFESSGSKDAAIRALAISSLDVEKIKLLDKLFSYTKSQRKVRDKIAHWIWGSSPSLPEALILCDPKIMWSNAGMNRGRLRQAVKDNNVTSISMEPVERKYVYSYTLKSLQSDTEIFASLAALINDFLLYLPAEKNTQLHADIHSKLSQDARLA